MESVSVCRGGSRATVQLDDALAELNMLAVIEGARRECQEEALANKRREDKILYKLCRDGKRRFKQEQQLLRGQKASQQQQQQQTLASLELSEYKFWDAERSGPLLSLPQKEMKVFPSTSRTRHLFMPYDRGARQLQPRPLTHCSVRSGSENPMHRLRNGHHYQNILHHPHPAGMFVPGGYPSSSSSIGLHLSTLQPPETRQQNKSNPPSPVKSSPLVVGVEGNNPLGGFGAPLVRSKSLDNIALCPLAAGDEPLALSDSLTESAGPSRISRVDTIVESVSSRIGSLQLTAN